MPNPSYVAKYINIAIVRYHNISKAAYSLNTKKQREQTTGNTPSKEFFLPHWFLFSPSVVFPDPFARPAASQSTAAGTITTFTSGHGPSPPPKATPRQLSPPSLGGGIDHHYDKHTFSCIIACYTSIAIRLQSLAGKGPLCSVVRHQSKNINFCTSSSPLLRRQRKRTSKADTRLRLHSFRLRTRLLSLRAALSP